MAVGISFSHSEFNTRVGEAIDQSVPFSHRHHAYELGIDCRYCHTTVETGAFAGIPPTKTCMSCHSIIWNDSPLVKPVRDSWRLQKPLNWVRVNDLPKFVYFDHSIHISRGVSCNTCHGPVQNMTLTWRGEEFSMVWCLNCHRHPDKYLAQVDPNVSPKNQVFNLYWKLQAQAPLTQDEKKWSLGEGEETVENRASGEAFVKKMGVKTVELTDCNTCHR